MPNIEMGEYVVGAYLKLVERCDVVDYDVRLPGGGLAGLNELDVVGFCFKEGKAFLCEVTTHIDGVLYGSSSRDTLAKLRSKHEHQKVYADAMLASFPNRVYQFWSPRVPKGKLLDGLADLTDLEVIANGDYTRRVRELEKMAKKAHHDTGNPFFRALQILGALRE